MRTALASPRTNTATSDEPSELLNEIIDQIHNYDDRMWDVTPTGLVLHDDLTEKQVIEFAKAASRQTSKWQWGIGDILAYSEDREDIPNALEKIHDATGIAKETLRKYEMVSRRYSRGERSPNLPWDHHFRALPFPKEERQEVLAAAKPDPGETKPKKSARAIGRAVRERKNSKAEPTATAQVDSDKVPPGTRSADDDVGIYYTPGFIAETIHQSLGKAPKLLPEQALLLTEMKRFIEIEQVIDSAEAAIQDIFDDTGIGMILGDMEVSGFFALIRGTIANFVPTLRCGPCHGFDDEAKIRECVCNGTRFDSAKQLMWLTEEDCRWMFRGKRFDTEEEFIKAVHADPKLAAKYRDEAPLEHQSALPGMADTDSKD